MLRARGVGREEGQVDRRLELVRELDLRLLRRVLQTLEHHLVLGDVDAAVLAELGAEVVDDLLVDVVAAEVGVAVGADDVDHVLADLEDRDVEGAAAEVVDRDQLVLLLVEAVGERRRGGLVDDALHIETGDAPGVLGGLALRVVEVCRDGDDRLGHGLTEIVLGRLLELAEHVRGHLGRRHLLAADVEGHAAVVASHDVVGHAAQVLAGFVEAMADEALGAVDRPLGVGDGLPLGDLSDEDLTLLGVPAHHRRRQAIALFVDDDLGLFALHHGDDRVGRAEVDSDDLSHLDASPWSV